MILYHFPSGNLFKLCFHVNSEVKSEVKILSRLKYCNSNDRFVYLHEKINKVKKTWFKTEFSRENNINTQHIHG